MPGIIFASVLIRIIRAISDVSNSNDGTPAPESVRYQYLVPARKTDTKKSKPRPAPARQPLVSNGFRKVTPKRLCRICHKPDWCGYSTDERTSICMRVSDGAKGTARNGGNIHVHNDVPPTSSPRKNTKPVPPSTQIARIEIR